MYTCPGGIGTWTEVKEVRRSEVTNTRRGSQSRCCSPGWLCATGPDAGSTGNIPSHFATSQTPSDRCDMYWAGQQGHEVGRLRAQSACRGLPRERILGICRRGTRWVPLVLVGTSRGSHSNREPRFTHSVPSLVIRRRPSNSTHRRARQAVPAGVLHPSAPPFHALWSARAARWRWTARDGSAWSDLGSTNR